MARALCRVVVFGYAFSMMVWLRGLRSRWLVLAVAAPALLAIGVGPAQAQTSPPQPSAGLQEPPPQTAPTSPQSVPAAQPSSSESPGLLNEMGKMFDKILPPLKSPGEAIDDLNARVKDAAKDTGDALSRLAKPGSMVSGRMICPPGGNGTPDCKSGADKLCQSKGYKEGRSLSTDSRETCSAKVLIPGRQRKPDDCRTDNYVTSALCL
jgi:hypothetical protein